MAFPTMSGSNEMDVALDEDAGLRVQRAVSPPSSYHWRLLADNHLSVTVVGRGRYVVIVPHLAPTVKPANCVRPLSSTGVASIAPC
jgi:hypothetical protein